MMTNEERMDSLVAMTKLKLWPLPDDDLPIDQSHLIITFGPPMNQEIRGRRMEEHFEKLSSLVGWSFFSPEDDVKQQGGDDSEGPVYGAVYSSGDMHAFDEVLNWLRAIERKNAFTGKNDLPFSNLVALDMREWSHGHLKNNRRKTVQSVLVNRKPKMSTFMKEKWDRERSKRRAEGKKYLEEYKERLQTDTEFAKREEEKRLAEKERVKQNKMDRLKRKERDEDIEVLFENFFGEDRSWGSIADAYKEKYSTLYMPIGDGRFLYGHEIVRKADLYEKRNIWIGTTTSKSRREETNDHCKTGEMLVPIREPLLGCRLAFADGKILPENNDDFDAWYRSLPIHKKFLVGKESEIHYLAPEHEQPDYPFVYVDWNVDCELSEEDYNSEQEDDKITENIYWDRDVCDHY